MPVQADSPSPEAARHGRARPFVALTIALATGVVAVDQLTKLWATSALSDGGSIAILGDLLSIRLTYNSGAAFSMGSGYTWIFTIVTAVAIIAIGVVARRVRSRAWAATLGLVLGGAATHLLDRLLRDPGVGRGHVVDFIDYAGLFVGNVADISLVVGASVWVLLSLRGIQFDGRRAHARTETRDREGTAPPS